VSPTYESCPAVPVAMTNPLLQLQVEAGKTYYVQYRPGSRLAGGDMKLMKDATAVKEMDGLKPAQAGHLAPPTVEQAISKIETALTNAGPPDFPACIRQPLQQITVTKDGFQFVAVGKEARAFIRRNTRSPCPCILRVCPI